MSDPVYAFLSLGWVGLLTVATCAVSWCWGQEPNKAKRKASTFQTGHWGEW